MFGCRLNYVMSYRNSRRVIKNSFMNVIYYPVFLNFTAVGGKQVAFVDSVGLARLCILIHFEMLSCGSSRLIAITKDH